MLATDCCEGGGNRQRRVGERAYMGTLGFGQRLFAILFQRVSKMTVFCGFQSADWTWFAFEHIILDAVQGVNQVAMQQKDA